MRMHPLLQQCYDAASGARMLASSFKSGEVGALRIALSHSVDLSILIPYLDQIKRQFNRLEFRFLRGNARRGRRISEEGRSRTRHRCRTRRATGTGSTPGRCSPRISISSSTGGIRWRRRDTIGFDDLRAEQWLSRNYCEHSDRLSRSLREHGVDGRSQPRDLLGARPDRAAGSRYRHRRGSPHRLAPGHAEARRRSRGWTRAAPCTSTASPGASAPPWRPP